MIVADAFFYLFAAICVGAGLMVITARNPVHAVLFLILAFVNSAGLFILLGAEFLALILVVVYVGAVAVLFLILAFVNSAGLFILLGAEFLALILVVVYVGAVAVLFLFVVMMLDVDFAELRAGFIAYMPVGALIGIVLLIELVLVLGAWIITPEVAAHITTPTPPSADISNTEALGQVLYTKYVYFFEAAGIVLLIAMIGAIVLTLHHKEGVKRQSIAAQVGRRREDAIEVRHVEPGQGL